EDISITFTVCNDDNELGMPNNRRGLAPNVTFQTVAPRESGAQTLPLNQSVSTTRNINPNDCLQFNRTGTVPASAQVGARYCATLRSNKNYGWSSNRQLGGHPIYAWHCV